VSWDALLVALSLPELVASGYLFALTLLSGRRDRPPPVSGQAHVRFALIVPAHDEETGIGRTVQSLLALDYPPELRRVTVVADNCADQTAARASEAGAEVLERQDAQRRGKGYALSHAFGQVVGENWADAVVVVDADTVASPNLLRAFASRIDAGAAAVQAHYGVANPEAGWRTRLMALAFALFHGVRSLGRERLGLSCGLRGNGMCFTAEVLRRVPHEAFSIVEDVEYGIRLAEADIRVHYASEAEVRGEMVASERDSRSQRRRWEQGRFAMARKFGVPLVLKGVVRGDPVRFDLGMDLLVPPLTWLVLTWGLGFGAAMAACVATRGPLAALWTWTLAGVFLGAYVSRGWQLSGVGARGLVDLCYVPVYVVWKVTLLFRRAPHAKDAWIRTAR
jgi:1,2-diacylglycerol 3-beta-glucosyltransferase